MNLAKPGGRRNYVSTAVTARKEAMKSSMFGLPD
jgi:hypothetical protein